MDPAEEAAVRRQIESTLRVMTISAAIGLVVLVVLAIAVSSLRGVFILAAIVYLFGSLGAQWYLRRRFLGNLKG
jgi:ABC-type bacteriocin/lantibiotic exporter with double-glycine peptidase domain